jgi:putative DNA primase/helicase
MKATARGIYAEAADEDDDDRRRELAKHAKSSESAKRIADALRLAQTEPGIPVLPEGLDRDLWLLNVENGTLDLRTGKLGDHRRENLITKLAPVEYDPDALAPRFAAFLRQVFDDEDVIAFVRRFAGYSLTGSTEERALAILYGLGKNGKSTLVELLKQAAGDYTTSTDTETILAKRHQGVGNDVAALKGARFVAAAEVEQGRVLAESKVKQLTGSDTVTARFLYSEPFDFKPEFKLWLSTNNKPVIRGTDDAIWDRIRLIPFTRRFEGANADSRLPEKLREELPGVLAWMVRGCLEWRKDGLGEPEQVAAATEDYRGEMDTLAAFFEDRCVIHANASAGATPLYNAYRQWCDEGGETRLTQTRFGRQLRERGFSSKKAQTVTWYGIGLRDDRLDPDRPGRPDQGVVVDSSYPDPGREGGPEGAKEEGNRLKVDGSYPNRLSGKSRIDTPNTAYVGEEFRQFRPQNHKTSYETAHETEKTEKSLQPSNRLTEAPVTPREGRPSPEQTRRVRELVDRGWSEWAARCEVLAKDHEIGCECELCA